MLLQVVPTVTSVAGQPGVEGVIHVAGSGFINGAETITVGGRVITDGFVGDSANSPLDAGVSGTRNSDLGFYLALGVAGPITVTTAMVR